MKMFFFIKIKARLKQLGFNKIKNLIALRTKECGFANINLKILMKKYLLLY